MYYVNHYALERFFYYLKMCVIYTVKTKLKALNSLPNIGNVWQCVQCF